MVGMVNLPRVDEPQTAMQDDCSKSLPTDKAARVAAIALFATVGSVLFGLDIGYIGPIISSDSFKRDVAHINIHDPSCSTSHKTCKLSGTEEGLIVSLFSIGAMTTACPIISSYFMNTWGRRDTIILGSAIFIVGSAMQATANNLHLMFAGRFVAGMSIGLLSSVIVLYQMELAPARFRGSLGTLYQFGITFGILVAAIIDEAMVEHAGGWRTVIWIMSIPAVLLCLGLLALPRSPRWLVQQSRSDEALEVMLTIRTEEEAYVEIKEIQEDIQKAMAEGDPAWSELFHWHGEKGRIGRLLALGVTLQLLQQLVGMNAFMYFGPDIFEGIGFSKNLFTTINNAINFLSTIPAILLADVKGRRTLMRWSSVSMALACGVMGVLGTMYVQPNEMGGFVVANRRAGWCIAFCVFFFVFSFAYGFGPIVWVYVGEIFPMKYRARAVGLCTMANWAGNFAIAQFTPVLLENIRLATFFVFGFFCVVGAILSAWLPETKGVPLELIDQRFDNKWGFKSTRKGAKLSEDSEDSEASSSAEWERRLRANER
eukprot:TRINITY_DN6316_c0_g2_i1.p1 TRINITY_DN6316_c0_g2~~TRINITY_DN6316_c0_g2_i1.p1  ORF type:complete len:542 (+),score=82.83 TRINITY_DN6316_c0_g2_i1:125-1750(+)